LDNDVTSLIELTPFGRRQIVRIKGTQGLLRVHAELLPTISRPWPAGRPVFEWRSTYQRRQPIAWRPRAIHRPVGAVGCSGAGRRPPSQLICAKLINAAVIDRDAID